MLRQWLTVFLSCVALSLAARDASAEVRAGAAKADVTPVKWPVPLVGRFNQRLADKAWDPLYARAMVLDDGKTKIAIVVVDSCYIPRNIFDDAKRRASAATGIPAQNMLMSATHTHTGPPSRDRREDKADPEYLEHLTKGIAQAVEDADANLEPAEVAWGVTPVPEEVFNRRWFMKPGGIVPNPFGLTDDTVRMNPPVGSDLLDRPAGPTDPDVSVISVRAKGGRPIALLANYSLHYVGGIPEGGVSADYFGEFGRIVEERLASKGEHPPVVGILSNGTSGDVNNIDFKNRRPAAKPFERMRQVAQRVADAALAAVEKSDHRSDVTLAAAQQLLTLEKRRPAPAQVERAKEFLASDNPDALPPRAIPYAKWTLELDQPPHSEELVLQALRIGEVGIAAIPCETFAETGLEIKEKSPLKPSFTIELANGHYGYLPTPRQHAWGGYETWMGTNILEIEASDKISAVVLDLLENVSKK